ncbi:alpha/beta fold hydrolase [Kribbella sandramycini]|uniref:Alpha/beta fold hydrolase n=1 Tax=Kribbella sandramycini TaxID=60450 RepID=A0A7Y4KWN2_9ACTN|nr:alpha/beta fold hydrolase [Kribbella sandramycini]MBB6567451.1 pimeloyl-ACP methyl ester carboxylesterase [Kribbella sandramycini]NOL39940.1 alpha/beta fold hydrolase [Kribbella sandramycini]
MSERPALLLVHGAWHGSWCWQALRDSLDGRRVETVDLPSVGSTRHVCTTMPAIVTRIAD